MVVASVLQKCYFLKLFNISKLLDDTNIKILEESASNFTEPQATKQVRSNIIDKLLRLGGVGFGGRAILARTIITKILPKIYFVPFLYYPPKMLLFQSYTL